MDLKKPCFHGVRTSLTSSSPMHFIPDVSWFAPRQVATETGKALTREGHGLMLPLCLFNMHQEKGLKQMIEL